VNALDLLLHPVRLRIVHAMSGGRLRTTNELCADLADVPRTTVYRHVGLLAEAGVLEVADEHQIRGVVERRYLLRGDRPVIDRAAAAAMTPQDHRRTFTLAMSVLLSEANAYLDRPDADPVNDTLGYTQFALWLTDQERADLIDHLIDAITAVRGNQATPDRKPYLISPILIPTQPSTTNDPSINAATPEAGVAVSDRARGVRSKGERPPTGAPPKP
jgi:DNA-binding transcriptional ArsR family regulator